MIDDFQVPDEYFGGFRHLVRRMPVELQTNETFLQTLLLYLKLGGEKLASHRIEIEKAEFETELALVKRRPSEQSRGDASDVSDQDSDDQDSDDQDSDDQDSDDEDSDGEDSDDEDSDDEDSDDQDSDDQDSDDEDDKDGMGSRRGDVQDIDPDEIEP
jgi:hypothetical protein